MTSVLTDPFEELLPAYLAGSLDDAARRSVESHLNGCPDCQASMREWEVVRSAAHAVADAVHAPSRGLLDRVWERLEEESRSPRRHERLIPAALRQPMMRRALAGMAAAAVLALALGFTPVGSFAQGLLQVMRPQQFTVVPITLPEAVRLLDRYGEFSESSTGNPRPASTAAEAGAATGLNVLTPSSLPRTVAPDAQYMVVPPQTLTFTFSASEAAAAARAHRATLPPMPANIDGSSVQLTSADAVLAVYRRSGGSGSAFGLDEIPMLIIGQTHAPAAITSGVPVSVLQDYLLSQPGISDELENAIRAIGDPTTTWPVPVPLGEVKTRNVDVQGVRGTMFIEPSGFGAGVLWVKDGIVYAVAGPLDEDEVLEVARSLR
jgi:anti-sigma factor RsiW